MSSANFSYYSLVSIWLLFQFRNVESQGRSLSFNYYDRQCPRLQALVEKAFVDAWRKDNTISAAVLRLFFHDALINGVDGSILLNGTKNNLAEKDDTDIKHLRGFDVVDNLKALVESSCPRIVSCADVLTLLTKFAVKQAGGPTVNFKLGRLDGFASNIQLSKLLSPHHFFTSTALLNVFFRLGLSPVDLVALSGAHTLGVAHCDSVRTRIYPQIDAMYEAKFGLSVRRRCPIVDGRRNPPTLDSKSKLSFDQTGMKFDNQYFQELTSRRGLMISDNELLRDPRLNATVARFASSQSAFFNQFRLSMIKLSEINLSSRGNVRIRCSVLN